MNINKMTKFLNKLKQNKILLISVIIAIIVIIAILTTIIFNNDNKEEPKNKDPKYVEQVEEGVKLNKSSKMKEEKKLGDLSIKNLQLTTKSGITTLVADVKNNGSSKTQMKIVEVKLLDENGEKLTELTGIIQELGANESTQLNISMTSDFIKAYDYTISEK